MTTIKMKFRPSTVEGKQGRVYFQVTQNRVTKQINVNCKIFAKDWNYGRHRLNIAQALSRHDLELITCWDRVRFEYKRLQQIVQHRDQCKYSYSADDIATEYTKRHKSSTVFGFALETIAHLKEVGNITNAENYYSLLVSFMCFRKGENIEFKSLNSDMLEAYEAHLKHTGKGRALNSISFYMRTLRAIFNRAVEKGIVKEQTLFKRVYTSIEKTAKRAIPLSSITLLKEVYLEDHPKLILSRDLFLFSFYTRGMSFVDIAYLKKRDLRNGILSYRRSKTGQSIHVKWEPCMEEIVQRHGVAESEYLLPIIVDPAMNHRQQYIDMRDRVNRHLKRLIPITGISHNLTMYTARHSWASAAKVKNISISVISEAMGHNSESTTRIYLASLEAALIDDANSIIIESV